MERKDFWAVRRFEDIGTEFAYGYANAVAEGPWRHQGKESAK